MTASQDEQTFTPIDDTMATQTAEAWHAPSSITKPAPCPTALNPDRLSAIMLSGLRYDTTKNTISTGACTDNMTPQWALINTALTSDALYANSNPDSTAVQTASTGSFTGTTTISTTPDPKTQAPTLVMPDGSGLFTTATGWVAPPAQH